MWWDFYQSIECLAGESKYYQSRLCETKITTSGNKEWAAIKPHGQKQLKEERVCFGLWFQRHKNPSQQCNGMAASYRKDKEENSNLYLQAWGREMEVEGGWVYKLSKLALSDVIPPATPSLLNLHNSATNWWLVFKRLSIWGISHTTAPRYRERPHTHLDRHLSNDELGGTLELMERLEQII